MAVIVPAFHSETTVERSLASLVCQDYRLFEILLVESEPGGATEQLVHTVFPSVRYIGVERRLLPQAARNLAVQQCRAELLLFTDPDIYLEPDWVSKMVATYERNGGAIAGALDNATSRWLDWGIHLAKFDLFLPGGELHPGKYCASGNMLCSREDFERVGGFEGDDMLGDLLISWKFVRAGIPITFLPDTTARHHHLATVGNFMRERFERGRVFGRLRKSHARWGLAQTLKHVLYTLSGLRLVKLVFRTAANARRARRLGWFIATLPLVTMGHAAWLAGELQGYGIWETARSVS